MQVKKNIIFVLVFVLLLSVTILEARKYTRYKRYKRYRAPSATDVWNKSLKQNDNENFYTPQKRTKYRRHKKRKKSHKKRSSSVEKKEAGLTSEQKIAAAAKIVGEPVSSEKKIQSSLAVLGFFVGEYDGNLNSYETRNAIKAMNQSLGNSNKLFLDQQTKGTLLYLADLYRFDKYLHLKGDDELRLGVKIQTALKIMGFYHDEIDALLGPETKSCILAYKEANNMQVTDKLEPKEEVGLIAKAIELNQKNISDAKESLKGSKVNLAKEKPIKIDSTTVAKDEEPTSIVEESTNKVELPALEDMKKSKSNIELSDSFE